MSMYGFYETVVVTCALDCFNCFDL